MHKLSHHAPVKIPKSKYNFQFFNLKLIAEDVIRYFSNKSAFHDKLEVSFPAGGLFNLHALFWDKCMHVFSDTVWNFTGVWHDVRKQSDVIFRFW